MLSTWWFVWLAFMFLFLVPPMGYGWGYRGWGPPVPRYIQRRRAERANAANGPSATFDHHAWGWGGDFLWMIVIIGVFWALFGYFWWR